MLLVSLFFNHFVHEIMYNFFRKTSFPHLWTLLSPVLILKTIPNWFCPVLGFIKKIIYHPWLQQFFSLLNFWNTRFNINIIFVVVFTCMFYILVLPFVGVNTCNVILMFSISITQQFKKIINTIQGLLDSIQGVMLFLICLAQFNYFFSKTLNLSLQSINIW